MAGLILVQTPEEVTQAQTPQPQIEREAPNLPALVSHLHAQWEKAKRRKIHIEHEMLDAKRQREGEYSAAEIEMIKKIGGTDAFRNLTDVKCRTGASWVRDIIFQPGDKPWGLEPTPIPDLPQDVAERIKERVRQMAIDQAVIAEMQSGEPVDLARLKQAIEEQAAAAMEELGGALVTESNKRAERMSQIIDDQLTEAKFEVVAARFIDDLMTYHAGILKGPVTRMRQELKWENQGGQFIPTTQDRPYPFVDRTHPLDFYPVNPYDIEFAGVFERHRWHPGRLQQLLGMGEEGGYRDEEIRTILSEHKAGSLGDWLWTDNERDHLNNLTDAADTIDCLECWDAVPGHMLEEWGIEVDDPDKHHQIHAFMIGRRLIRLILNPHPLGKRPYHLASFVAGDTIWGKAPPQLLKDSQKAANSVYRAAINNCAMAWGPMSEVNKDRLAAGESAQIHPLKQFMTTDDMQTGQPAVRLTDIPYKGDAMLQALAELERRADDESGIPAYAHGQQDVGGAGNTASGLSMLLNMATKTIKDVVRNIDDAIEGLIEGFFVWNMEFHPDQSAKGDLRIEAKGSSALVIKEQMAIRLREFLQQTANPVDMQITGVEGRAYALRESAKGLNLEADKLVPGTPTNQVMSPQHQQQPSQQPQTLNQAGEPAGGQDAMLPEARAYGQ